jgi:N-dimethylarginine dimethylaminohydrolase
VRINMGATFVMSYPAAEWNAAAGRAPREGVAKPRAALEEWIALADAILHAGGRILVCDPPAGGGAPSLPYTADWGALVRRNDRALFLLPNAPERRQSETEIIRAFFASAGVEVQPLGVVSSGRGDLLQVSPGHYLFLAGTHSEAGASAIVARELGPAARYVEGSVVAPYRFGDEVAAVFVNKGGDVIMIAHEPGMKGRTVPELRSAFQKADVISIDADDADAGACSALCVNGTLIHPPGLSTGLRGHLLRRGLQLVELSLPELQGRGGGGARSLVNELYGFIIGKDAPDYTRARDRIVALVEKYPETAS